MYDKNDFECSDMYDDLIENCGISSFKVQRKYELNYMLRLIEEDKILSDEENGFESFKIIKQFEDDHLQCIHIQFPIIYEVMFYYYDDLNFLLNKKTFIEELKHVVETELSEIDK